MGLMPISDLLALAEQQRGAGRLADAEATCRRILQAQPDEPNAVHILGLIAHQSGKLPEAIGHLQRAAALAPNVALYQANLGEMCRLAGVTRDPAETIADGSGLDRFERMLAAQGGRLAEGLPGEVTRTPAVIEAYLGKRWLARQASTKPGPPC